MKDGNKKINCPECGTEIDVDNLLFEAARKEASKSFSQKEKDLKDLEAKLKDKDKAREKELEAKFDKKLDKERIRLKTESLEKAKEESKSEIKAKDELIQDLNKRIDESNKSELEYRKKLMDLERKEKSLELEVQRQLDEERGKIKEEALKLHEEDYKLKLDKKEKQIRDIAKKLDEANRKAESSSQELQGEVFEENIEALLSQEFPMDDFKPVPKGKKGADVVHNVKTPSGVTAGKILVEAKDTKGWQKKWIPKIKQDKRDAKAEFCIIVSRTLPAGAPILYSQEDVWVTNSCNLALMMVRSFRNSVLALHRVRNASLGGNEKAEEIRKYFSGTVFKQRIEEIVESHMKSLSTLQAERNTITKLWSERETSLQKSLHSIAQVLGDLNSISGITIKAIEGLNLLEEGKEE